MREAHKGRPIEECLSPELLRELVAYDPGTGLLTWREREPKHFEENPRLSPQEHCEMWNARWAGRAAFQAVIENRGYKYLRGSIFHRSIQASRVAWAVHFGRWPGSFIDHINGDATDNRIVNLRDTSPTVNARNVCRNPLNTSGFPGVSFKVRTKRWEASIGVGESQHVFLGAFDTLECAVAAREGAERVLNYAPGHGRRERTSGRYVADHNRSTTDAR